MRTTRTIWPAAAVALAIGATGCGRAVTVDPAEPVVAADRYDAVFDAAVTVLRDMRFTVDRQDRRYGVVTTRPMTASTFFEPWRTDNTTAEQVWGSTFNLRRRIVRVTLSPVGVDAAPSDRYSIDVDVALEQLQNPTRRLYTSAVRSTTIASSVRRQRGLRTERGMEQAFWRPIGADAALEARIASEVLRRSGARPGDEPVDGGSSDGGEAAG